jgi:glycine/D-amino acid oxidase-like deaminating enzyme
VRDLSAGATQEMHGIGRPVSGPAALPRDVDVVVVGGGIVGCAAAYRLAKRGLKVLLLEKASLASEQSGRNWGFVRQQGRDVVELPLMTAANRLWQQMSHELDADIEWTQGGNLALAKNEAAAEEYRQWAAMANSFGLRSQILSTAEIRSLLPGLSPSWTLGIFTPSDGHADPVKTTVAFAMAAVRHDARLVTGCTVTQILAAGGRIIGVDTDRGPVNCSTVICAAGVWSQRLLRGVGLDLPQRVARETVILTRPTSPLTRIGVWAAPLSFRQTRDGGFVLSLGGTGDVDMSISGFKHLRLFVPMFLKNREKFRIRPASLSLRLLWPRRGAAAYRIPDPRVNQGDVRECLHRMRDWFPALDGDLRLARAWAGLIEGTPDALPVIEAVSKPSGLVVATGFSGHGFAMGPIVGEIIADLVTRADSDFDLRPFRLARFKEKPFGKPKSLI